MPPALPELECKNAQLDMPVRLGPDQRRKPLVVGDSCNCRTARITGNLVFTGVSGGTGRHRWYSMAWSPPVLVRPAATDSGASPGSHRPIDSIVNNTVIVKES